MSANRIYVDVLKYSGEDNRYASYYKRYGQDFISKAEDYFLAIDRFNIPCDNIPFIIFNPTTNYYLVEMEYKGVYSGPISLTYIPSYPNARTTDKKYYYIFTFDIFLKMINIAINTAFAAIPAKPVDAVAPYFQVDRSTMLMQYVAQIDYYDVMATPPIDTFKLYLNRNLFTYFYGMPIYYDASALSRNAQFIVYSTYNNIVGDNYVMTTNKGISTLTNWNVCKGIIMTSDTFPTEQEDLPTTPQVPFTLTPSDQQNFSPSGLLNKRNILANFDFVYDNAHPFPDSAQYILNSVYKLIDMHGKQPINTIDLKIFWYDTFNNIYDLDIAFIKALSVRLVFLKKGTPNQ